MCSFILMNIIFVRLLNQTKSLLDDSNWFFFIGLEFYNDQISRRPSNKVHKILCGNHISFLIDLKFYFYFIFSALSKMLYLV